MVKPSATGSPKISSKNLGVAGASSKIKKTGAGRSTSANNENDSPSKPGPTTPAKDEASKNSRIKDIRKETAAKDVDLEKLTERITQLLELIERGKHEELKQSTDRKWRWPKGLKKLKHILSGKNKDDGGDGKEDGGDGKDDGIGRRLKDIKKDIKNAGHKLFGKKEDDGKEDGKDDGDDGKEDGDDGEKLKTLADFISGPVKDVLKGIGHAHFATTGLLVVVYCLERYQELSQNKKKCLKLLKEMCYVAGLVKVLKESRKGLVNVIEDATSLIVEGAIICCRQIDSPGWKRFFNSKGNKAILTVVTEKLDRMYLKINVQMGFRKSPLWKRRPKHADGIENSTKKVMKLLECDSRQKNAVTVILHGFKGRGKTTLAEAVFSEVKVEGYKYSKVRLFKDINSTRDIIEFQKAILQDLMEPEETVPDIRTHEDGQDALEEMLEKVEALIYIDNVLKSSELQLLLPKSVDNAKRVRFLLTTRDVEDFTYACPRLPLPRVYHVKGIEQPEDAMSILKKEIREGIDEIQFNEIIEICGGVPPMLTLVASFIGRADDKQKAYNKLKQEKEKCGIPDNCKDPDPFLDIIRSFFKKQDTLSLTVDEEDIKTPEMNTNRQQRILRSSSTLGKRKCNFILESGDQ